MTDSDSGALSQEEIAQQFLLPERQAKVNQLIRTMEHAAGGTEVLVPPTTGDMIADIEYCICHSTDCSRFMIGCDNCNEWYHGDCIGVTQKDAKSIKQFFCDTCREHDPSLQIKYKSKKINKEKEPKLSVSDSSDTERSYKDDNNDKHKQKKSSRRCGECTACHRSEDCARCDFCKGDITTQRDGRNQPPYSVMV